MRNGLKRQGRRLFLNKSSRILACYYKRRRSRIRKLTYSLLLLLALAGCAQVEKGVHIQNNTEENVEKAEKIFEEDDRLVSAIAIFHDKEILSGVTVKTFSRFHKSKIENELTKKLEKQYKGFEVTVSADSKIILETKKLMDIEDKDKLPKKIKELKTLSEEET
jgi:hypothetical protein